MTIQDVWLSFIPLFVAVDAVGLLPVFLSLTSGMGPAQKDRVIIQSLLTALGVATGFIFLGTAVFKLLNITMQDFMIAGGAILFCLAIVDLINPLKARRQPTEDMGAVPLGTPLIVGPAVLTTALVSVSRHGLAPTLLSVVLNIFLAGVTLKISGILMRVLGEAGSKALSKVMSLLLAAIAVMLIRVGIQTLSAHHP